MSAVSNRARLVQLIHVARRDLGLDEETYRAALKSATGKGSTSDMSIGQLSVALEAFKAKGFKVRHKRKSVPARVPVPFSPDVRHAKRPNPSPGDGGAKSRPLDQSALASKLRALWLDLHAYGAVRDPNESAMCSWASNSRSPNVTTAPQMMDGQMLYLAIERLKKWRIRYLLSGQLYCPTCDLALTPSLAMIRLFLSEQGLSCGYGHAYIWRAVPEQVTA